MKFLAIYQCQLCGTRFHIADKPFELNRDEGPELVAKIIRNQQMLGNPYLYEAPMNLPHDCPDGGIGIAQLAGFSPQQNTTQDNNSNTKDTRKLLGRILKKT